MLKRCFLSAMLLFFSVPLFSQTSAKPPLRWGGDAEGGAPYSFPNPKDPSKIIGYEVDLVDALAAEMNRRPEFVQNQWDGLVPGLQRGNYDLIVSGLEITADRQQEISFSEPYYLTFEQLTVRQETDDINSLADCSGRTVGTLKFSLADRILRAQPNVDVRSYEGDVTVYEDLANRRLDAVLLDYPIAIYYGKPNNKLKMVGEPIGRMMYGIGVRKEDAELLEEVNRALETISENGKLRQILERWGLWNELMAEYLNDTEPSTMAASEYEAYLKTIKVKRTLLQRLVQYVSYLPLLGKGAIITLELSIISMIVAVVIGLLVTLLRLYMPPPISKIAVLYVEIMRGTPLLLQLFFIFYGLPNIGIKLSPFLAAIIGLGLNYAAYEAELYRAGIQSIPHAQMEAALALGMTKAQAIRHIILPQAVRFVIPPVTNDFIALLKDSSLVSVITMVELTKVYGQLAATYYDYFGIGILAAAMYLLIGLPFVRLSRLAERHFNYQGRAPVKAPVSRRKMSAA